MIQDSYTDYDLLLSQLVDFSQKKSTDLYQSIKDSLYKYQFPFPIITIPKGWNLFRGRVHKQNESYFENWSDYSSIKEISQIKSFGRANEPKQSIFYCSDNQTTAAFEVSKISRQNYRPETEHISVGVWNVLKDLRVGVVPINSTIKNLNVTTQNLHNQYKNLLEHFENIGIDIPVDLLDFISDEFSQDAKNIESNYVISCAFANYMFDTRGFDSYYRRNIKLDGILYSSVQYEKEGMNLALNPKVINGNKIKLISVFKRTAHKINENTYRDVDLEIAKGINYKSGRIKWA